MPLITAESPFLLMVLSASVDNLIVTQRSSSAKKKRFFWRLGRNRRFVLIFEWETEFPTMGFLPVTWHTLAMTLSFYSDFSDGKGREFPGNKLIKNGILFKNANPRLRYWQLGSYGDKSRGLGPGIKLFSTFVNIILFYYIISACQNSEMIKLKSNSLYIVFFRYSGLREWITISKSVK